MHRHAPPLLSASSTALAAVAYYADKVDVLRDLFGARAVEAHSDHIVVDGAVFPVLNDVILLDAKRSPPAVRAKLAQAPSATAADDAPFSGDIQATFGSEWQEFPTILPEHEREFRQYFDIVPPELVNGKRVCDLGCGMGRWSYFLKDRARELILVDFSEAIFVARHNLRGAPNALFFLGDLTQLPFRRDFADLIVCLGVLHHLPIDALQMTRALGRFAPNLLIYLYSALDAAPPFWRLLFRFVDVVRRVVSRVHNARFRSAFTWLGATFLYMPLVAIGHALRPLGLSRFVPLYEFYRSKSFERVRQDVYDRFFTGIEQRFARTEILGLRDTYARVVVSEQLPVWHFLCQREGPAA